MTRPVDTSRLETQLESAEALLESAQLLHASLELDTLLRHLLRTVMGRLAVSKSLIAVENHGVMKYALVRGLPKLKAGSEFERATAFDCGIGLILPIGNEDHPVGLLGIGNPAKGALRDEEIDFLRGLLGIAASGITNAKAHSETTRLNRDLDQKVQELRALLDLVRGLTSTLEPEDIARLLALTLSGRWAVRKYAVTAWKDDQPLIIRQKGIEISGIESVKDEIASLPEAILVESLPDSTLKQLCQEQQGQVLFIIRSTDDTSGGVVLLGARPGNLPYNEADLEFGSGLVAQAAVAFDNAWYFRETLKKKEIEKDLETAASIQATLFPATMPKLPSLELAARNRPAKHCGGDYYDALAIPAVSNQSHLLCVADVSGKGLPASLLMSNMQASLRALLGRITSLTELSDQINSLLYATTPSNKYVTAILLEVDPLTGAVRYVNAGHTDCLLLRADGEAVWLKSTGTPLGLMPPELIMLSPYEERSFELQPGDLIALFSDGVTEAQNEREEEYGEDRVADFFRQIRNEPVETMVEKVFVEIDRYAGTAPQFDDITLMVLKRNQ